MNNFNLWDFGNLIAGLERSAAIFENVSAYQGLGGTHDPTFYQTTLGMIAEVIRSARVNEFQECLDTVLASESHLVSYQKKADISTCAAEVRHSRDALLNAVHDRKFLRIALERANYIDQIAFFGSDVNRAFPTAGQDICEVGNCLAAECNTAAVFHLMRSAEVALRALAADRRVVFPKGTLDSKQWGEIITQLETVIGKLIGLPAANWPSEPIRQAQIRFYQEAMIEFRAFNDAWRRHVSHAHDGAFYDRDQSNSVKNHTERFMQKLATKLSEGTITSEYWQQL